MKKINKIKILLVVFALSLFSCDDYLDVNDSPNTPNTSNINPQLVLSAAIVQPYRTFITSANDLGNVWMNNWAANVNTFTGGHTQEYSLALPNSFHQEIW